MCGIVGIISYMQQNGKINLSYIANMMKRQKHRGPDDLGIRAFDFQRQISKEVDISEVEKLKDFNSVVGFNRLSIRDISINGHQPMVKKKEKEIILCFNGELYNADILREKLQKKGYIFLGESDTEVVINSYIEYGLDKCLEIFDGMFAFSIIDLNLKRCFLVRDRVGIKPLYYTYSEGILFYASEIKSFLDIDNLKLTINEDAVTEFLIYRCIHNKTLFREIHQVYPGEYIEVSFEEGIQGKKYFNLDNYIRKETMDKSLEEKIVNSVKSQMVSDVSLGCQLSGGVDSSIVTYIAAQYGLQDTESIIFNEEGFSEKTYIDIVKNKTRTVSNQYLFEIKDFKKYFEKSIYHLESILNHPNSMGILKMTELAKKNVSVLLSGEGADELMGGYEWFALGKKNTNEGIEKFVDFVINFPQVIPDELIQKSFVNANIDKIKNERRNLIKLFSGSPFDKQVKYELSTYLPEVLLRQDKMSMANSIENRVPILANEVIEYALEMPERELLSPKGFGIWRKYEGKNAFKKICAKYYGKKFAYRDKVGFPIPIVGYMRQEFFKNYFYDVVYPKMKIRSILDAEFISKQYDCFYKTGEGNFDLLWRTICFEVWCQLFIDKREYKEIC